MICDLLLLFSHSVMFNSATPWIAACQVSLSLTISWSLLKLMSIESLMPSNHLILCRPLLPLPSIFPGIRVCSNESALPIRWPKYWCFNFNISPSNENSGLISFRIDCFDLFAIQGTLKSLLQHHSLKASIFLHSNLLYGPTRTSVHDYWKNHGLTMWPFVDKVMSLLYNILSRFVIAFLPKRKHLFNFMSAVTICCDF